VSYVSSELLFDLPNGCYQEFFQFFRWKGFKDFVALFGGNPCGGKALSRNNTEAGSMVELEFLGAILDLVEVFFDGIRMTIDHVTEDPKHMTVGHMGLPQDEAQLFLEIQLLLSGFLRSAFRELVQALEDLAKFFDEFEQSGKGGKVFQLGDQVEGHSENH